MIWTTVLIFLLHIVSQLWQFSGADITSKRLQSTYDVPSFKGMEIWIWYLIFLLNNPENSKKPILGLGLWIGTIQKKQNLSKPFTSFKQNAQLQKIYFRWPRSFFQSQKSLTPEGRWKLFFKSVLQKRWGVCSKEYTLVLLEEVCLLPWRWTLFAWGPWAGR